MNTPTLDETRTYISELFAGVLDKGGVPYAEHCFRVEQGLPFDATEDERHAALLHDVLEDCSDKVSPVDLLMRGYSDRTVELVHALTFSGPYSPYTGTYMDKIRRIRDSGDRGLINIKLSDNRDNSDPVRHLCFEPLDSERRMKKYNKARMALNEALEEAA